jgi:valyl-tRNA synthetase
MDHNFKQFRLSDALLGLYGFIWDDFCSWYLEMIKPEYGQPIDQETYDATIALYSDLMLALHPFMPFISEEIWHQLAERTAGDDCCAKHYPKHSTADNDLIAKVEAIKDVIAKVRELRQKNQLKPRDPLVMVAQDSKSVQALFAGQGFQEMVLKMASLESLDIDTTEPDNAKSFISGTDKYYIVLNQEIDVAAEIEKMTKEIEYQRGFIRSIEAKLSNERFVSSAPAQVVDNERKKLADGQARMAILEESIKKMQG